MHLFTQQCIEKGVSRSRYLISSLMGRNTPKNKNLTSDARESLLQQQFKDGSQSRWGGGGDIGKILALGREDPIYF